MSDAPRPAVVIVGAGAAGLATAIFASRAIPNAAVTLVDGAARPGAKILVSGGTRCNVTNAVVTERDYWGGKCTVIRRVLARLPVRETITFFEAIGVRLKEEPTAKLFPVTDRARDVLDALLRAAQTAGTELSAATRVQDVRPSGDRFVIETSRGPIMADAVVLATGGLSLPKTGSDGAGLEMARRLGHRIVPTTPALAPLLLDESGFHRSLSGVTQNVELLLADRPEGRVVQRIAGPMVWTHFGISGPAALDLSRHWLRARLDQQEGAVSLNLQPEWRFESADAYWLGAARERPRASVRTVLADILPGSVADAILASIDMDPDHRLATLPRDGRRALSHAVVGLSLPVTGSRGYNYAEATAGGVSLDDIDPATLESRRIQGLFFAGEMLDVDGRLGGFNFQWAWSSARVVADGIARRLIAAWRA